VSEAERRTLRVFISSPADVRPERLIAERMVRHLSFRDGGSGGFPISAALRRDAPPKVGFAIDSSLEEGDLPPMIKRKRAGR
jgi:hypothetical protein